VAILLIGATLLAACAASPSPPAATPSPSPTTSPQQPSPSVEVTPAPSGFAFSAEGVIAYYQGQGFDCSEVQPSTSAADHFFQGCQKTDAEGRTLLIGIVTDPAGALADAHASMKAADGEAFLEPTSAMDHLAGFLGAMLGDERGTSLLAWLAGHLGDAYAETSIDVLTVATYTPSQTDHTQLSVEIASQAYLAAPTPGAS
jgi:hypothetical protein